MLTTSAWSLAISSTDSKPRKSGAWSMKMCRAWDSIHSPQYSRRRISWISGVVVTPQMVSIASVDALWYATGQMPQMRAVMSGGSVYLRPRRKPS